MDAAIHFAAHKVGLGALKPKQVEVIKAFASGSDVFVSLPTGYGKSFCYVLLPLVFDQLLGRSGSIVLCISPLTSLMMEQRSKFSKLGLCCEYVGQLQQDMESMAKRPEGLCSTTFCKSGINSLQPTVEGFTSPTYLSEEYCCCCS